MARNSILGGVLAFGALLLSACGGDDASVVEVSGSSTVLPVVSRAAEQYAEANPDVQVIVNAGGSGVGVSQLGNGQSDIGMISRDITDQERAQFPGVTFTTHSIGRDAVVPVVSSEIYEAGVTALSLDQIASIYRGEVENWSAFGGPDREILVIDKEASRGTRQVFMSYVLGDPDAEAPAADLVLGSNNEEQTAIAQSDAAIGMLSLAWFNDDVRGLAIVDSEGMSAEPTVERILDGQYPIVRDLVVVTRNDVSAEAQAFVDYLLTEEGQDIVENAGYVRVGD